MKRNKNLKRGLEDLVLLLCLTAVLILVYGIVVKLVAEISIHIDATELSTLLLSFKGYLK